jgi:hypothetical protein
MSQVAVQLFLVLVAMPLLTVAQAKPAAVDPDERVLKYDLAGPRFGTTFLPNGDATTQFGWHFESSAAPSKKGPWFIVEKVFLVRGVERNTFSPSMTLVFGMRVPGSFEFGAGPSVTLGGYNGWNTGVVGAIGQSFRVGGIRIPVNLAYAAQKGGEGRWTLLTGWAIRDLVGQPPEEPTPAKTWDQEESI